MKKKLIIGIIVAIVVLVGVWYLASPLIIDKTVNEQNPLDLEGSDESSVILYSGNFMDADSFHKVSGEAKIISDGEINYLRLENFESTNGPDLKVYFSTDLDASDYISLGELKGNVGDQNYLIEEDIDFEKYKYALVWCEQFSVLFGSAELG